MRGRYMPAAVILLAFVPGALGDPGIDLEKLTLQEAISLALERSPEIRQAKLTVAIAQLDLRQTELRYLLIPDITLHGFKPRSPEEGRFGVALSLDLKGLLRNAYRHRQSKLRLFNAQIYLENVKNRVIESVTRSYFDLIIARRRVELLRDQLQNSLKLQELLRIRFEAGQVEIKQLLDAMENTANLRLELLRAEADLRLKELHLKQLIGLRDEEKGAGEDEEKKLSSLSHSLTPHSSSGR